MRDEEARPMALHHVLPTDSKKEHYTLRPDVYFPQVLNIISEACSTELFNLPTLLIH